MSFYLRHFAGFLIQFGAGIFLCQLPFGEESLRVSRRRVTVSCVLFTLVSSALFPVFISTKWIAGTPYQALAANLYMSAVIIIFIFQYFWTLRVETVKKLIVLVLTLFYAATQYLLVGIIEMIQNLDEAMWEVYLPIDLVPYSVTAVLMLPPSALLMSRVVREYLAEMELESVRREFRLVLAVTFLYFAMMVIYSSGPTGLLVRFWMWIIPPMVVTALLLGLFYWRLFQESLLIKRENDERRALEIQKLQYENIHNEMDRVKSLRHDMRHSLNYLSDLLAKGEEETAKEYLNELTIQISHHEMVNYCKNVTINGLLQYYVGMAVDQDIRCKVHAKCDDVSVSAVDLTVMLGNMMENAIRVCAAMEKQDRWITVNIGVLKGSMLIQVVNPCQEVHPSGRYRMDGSFLPAAAFQSDRSGGGYGLRSLEHTAGKYGGCAVFRYDERAKTFTSRIRIDLQ